MAFLRYTVHHPAGRGWRGVYSLVHRTPPRGERVVRCLLARPPRGIDKYTLPGGNQHTPLFISPHSCRPRVGKITKLCRGEQLLREALLHDRITPPLLVAAPKWPDHFVL